MKIKKILNLGYQLYPQSVIQCHPTMELCDIESALKGQFVWNKPMQRKFHCNPEIECSADTAVIVFIGLAETTGFREKDICNYLRIDLPYYRRMSATYRIKMREAAEKISNQLWNYNRQDLAQRVWMKNELVRRNMAMIRRS